MAEFDVFLSHNSQDKAAVKALGEDLKARGITAWLDEWELRPGKRWQKELEAAIASSRSVAVFVGANGLGPWEEPEMEVFLDRAMHESELPVIPVLLPGAPEKVELRPFLKLFTWVDLRGGVTPEGLERLVWGITGRKPEATNEPRAAATPRPPALHNLPFPSLDVDFKGREAALEALAQSLEGGGAAALVQAKALHGLGGVGKTRLAVEYARRFGQRYRAAFFVPAESPEALQAGLARVGQELLTELQLAGKPEEEAKQAVLAWLRKNRRWLLILDNVDTEPAQVAVRELLALDQGHVLVTSRLSGWPKGVEKLEVAVLEPAAAVALLLASTEGRRQAAEDDETQAGKLAELLGYLPLALELAGAYIATQKISFAAYLTAWEKDRARVLAWYEASETAYPFSVAITWSRTVQQLHRPARALLRLLAHLAPEPLAVAMVDSGEELLAECAQRLEEEESHPAGSAPEPPASPREALAELARYSLVSWPGDTASVHRLVQEVVRSQIPADHQPAWVERAVRLVLDFSPSEPEDVRTWLVWDPLRPHAERVIQLAELAGVMQPTAALMNRVGILLHSKALHLQAEPLMRRALGIDEASYGPEHPEVATDLNNLALLLKATNRLVEAEPLMRRALGIDEVSYGPEHPEVARDLNNLALLLQATNRLVEAEPLMRRSLGIDEASYGPEHPKVATRLNNLAQLLQDTNRLGEAEPLMRRALGIDESSYGPEHPDVARDLNNLAQLLQDTNRLVEAEPLMRRALGIDEASYGPEHPNVAIRLNNLAHLLQATNRLSEAEPLKRRVVEIFEASLGKDHPNVAAALNNLAQLLQATSRLEEAEPLMRRALGIDEASYGPEHPEVATRLNNLAQLLQATNRLGEAEPLMRRALAIDEASYGPEHPNVAIRLNNLATLLQDTKRLGEAEPLMRRAAEIWERNLGEGHPNVGSALNNLAQLLQDTNRLGEAEPLMRRALAIDEASFGPEHPAAARDLNNLAQLLKATNRLGEAEPLMRRALEIDEASYGPEHPGVARDLNNLARLFQDTNRLAEAEPLMRRAVEIFLLFGLRTGHEHPNAEVVLGNYRSLLAAQGKTPEEVEAALEAVAAEVKAKR